MPPAKPTPNPENPTPPETSPARSGNPESRWLSVEQIRKQQRCRRAVVIAAMESGALPYERRGRIRYARICDVLAWEQARLVKPRPTQPRQIHPDLAEFL